MSAAAELSQSFSRLALSASRQSARPCVRRRVLSSRSRAFSSNPLLKRDEPSEIESDSSSHSQAINAAAEINFDTFRPSQAPEFPSSAIDPKNITKNTLTRLRVIPASPSYFSATPQFLDDFLFLSGLLRKYQQLPTLKPAEAARTGWISVDAYRNMTGESVKDKRFDGIVSLCKRLDLIMPDLMPEEVTTALDKFRRIVDPAVNRPKPLFLDEHGRARAVGRRKTSHAVVYLVEGTGEVLVNGRTLAQAFGKINDRESVIWALKATNRLDKYNVFGIAKGGGTTGQAEALTMALARALLVHEPALKPALRKAGVVRRDPRMVERKKPGHVKARKMPTWVKR